MVMNTFPYMSTVIYLADLRHNFGGVLATDCMPLGVGYMKAVMDRDLPKAEVRIFAYPDRLEEAMRTRAPDVLMVSNYVWNEALGLHFLRRAHQLNPNAFTVMGGPNISIEAERQAQFVADHPEIDAYALGEADFLARDLVLRYLDAGRSRAAIGDAEIPSCVYRRSSGEIVRNEITGRLGALDDIPSPWLTGVMDEFFDGKLAPIIETNRGCPFRCTFCVQGTSYYTKVNYFSMERLKAEIERIGELIQTRAPAMGTLRIADPNYGMYERDIEISGAIGEAQAKYAWPTFIDATTGKNRPERIIASMEKVNGALVLYQAVQSLDDEVLRKINRANIKLDAYEKIMVHVRGRGLRSVSDLILGLPGETLTSHLNGLHRLIDAGTDQAHCFQSMMLKGADMEMLSTREKFNFTTRFRVLPKNFGSYGGEKVFDIEEIVVGTDTLPFADYVTARKHHLAFSIFWNDSWFHAVVVFCGRFGVLRSSWLAAMLEAMEADQGAMRALLDDFVAETVGELFETREGCAAFYAQEDNFQRLLRGEIGDNLMYKYRAKASFFSWEETCAVAMAATRRLLEARGAPAGIPGFDRFWSEFTAHVEASHASGGSIEKILEPVAVKMHLDIPAWIAAGEPADPSDYALDDPASFLFELTEEGAREIEAALAVWTSRLTGLSKLVTRIRVSSQVRSAHRLN
jgi:radical SAM superfamily enzyme YgiQ (UPF0313 family)